MILGIAFIITVISIIGCIKIKKPVIRGFLEMLALINIMIVALAGSFTYEMRYKIHEVASYTSPGSNVMQILDLIKRTQNLENQRKSLSGVILIVMGLMLLVLHYQVGGSEFRDFCSGLLLGFSIGMNIAGVIIAVSGISKQQR